MKVILGVLLSISLSLFSCGRKKTIVSNTNITYTEPSKTLQIDNSVPPLDETVPTISPDPENDDTPPDYTVSSTEFLAGWACVSIALIGWTVYNWNKVYGFFETAFKKEVKKPATFTGVDGKIHEFPERSSRLGDEWMDAYEVNFFLNYGTLPNRNSDQYKMDSRRYKEEWLKDPNQQIFKLPKVEDVPPHFQMPEQQIEVNNVPPEQPLKEVNDVPVVKNNGGVEIPAPNGYIPPPSRTEEEESNEPPEYSFDDPSRDPVQDKIDTDEALAQAQNVPLGYFKPKIMVFNRKCAQ
ncbi:hypothetical protein AGMMS5026_02230 [Endomicrobiia bacterium]|nr:hypothetical protein AGMMS49523_07460 [Endomicrobiia bacterium]GHT14827.1 hypothetical protein AGMMS49571_11160 [Endomicrobiia bacterium]GHT18659.1 hypothetical protein AGMMS49929_00740 [Endomicrobiia bacterium]GHT28889.1 hypothetical protein AGMMS49995_10460 [Endomicrobiia bacterium]GHT29841.1 hypothetical protein AGMMS5026_02230 [Endomicrobiia bacterium]